jgi:asparagine synthase (glutamine-hydrolysing)
MLGFSADALGLSQDFQLNDLRYEGLYVPSDFVSSVGRMEASFYMGNMLLRDSDVFGMANSLEIRVPFLDRDLLEWAFRLPGDVLLQRGAKSKSLLRSICADFYTATQDRQPKRGFVIPIERWLRGPLQEIAEESLRWLRGSGYLQPEGIRAVHELYTKPMGGSAWSRVWALVALGHWLRQNQALSTCGAAS